MKSKTNPVFLTMVPGESWGDFKSRTTRSLMDHAKDPKISGSNSTGAKAARGGTTGNGNIKAGTLPKRK